MSTHLLGPILIPIIMAFVTYAIGRKSKEARNVVAVVVTAATFLEMLYFFIGFVSGKMEPFDLVLPDICGLRLHFMMDGFRALYTTIASFMWLVCTFFAVEYNKIYHNRNRYYMFILWTLGATMGVFLSADLGTTFIFFEMASLTSYVWVAQQESKEALRAAETYLAVAVIGGLVMLMGLLLLWNVTGTLNIEELRTVCESLQDDKRLLAAGICIFWGFAAKAGAVPLHIWLPKAHPVAPAPASALLSGMLTKVGVFGVLVVSSRIFYGNVKWGGFVLIIGCATMFLGALLAVFSIDMKRTLACSSVSQIGFILIGVAMQCMLGEENGLAVRGTLLYMVNHSLFKLVLFLVAGVVFMNIHKLDFNIIKGFGRNKPILKAIYLSAALGISGIPLFSGYVSKTLIHESMVEYMNLSPASYNPGMKAIEWLFLISGGMTFAYMTKLFVVVFVEKNADDGLQAKYDGMKPYMNVGNRFLLCLAASIFVVLGVFPNAIFDKIADMGQSFMGLMEFGERVSYFSWENLSGSLISIAIGICLYFGIIRTVFRKKDGTYVNLWPKWLDLEDSFYRPVLKSLVILFEIISKLLDRVIDGTVILLRKTILKESPIPFEITEGNSFTYKAGSLLDGLKKAITGKDEDYENSFTHRLAMEYEKLNEASVVITRSLSFGLIFFCVGLAFTLIYMLWFR
ncbi:MAG: sodium:proton antiporter [Lachnospiraceae bacterium]|nr:sodium:proton antiporter [Lachnospiraceae bacterium]